MRRTRLEGVRLTSRGAWHALLYFLFASNSVCPRENRPESSRVRSEPRDLGFRTITFDVAYWTRCASRLTLSKILTEYQGTTRSIHGFWYRCSKFKQGVTVVGSDTRNGTGDWMGERGQTTRKLDSSNLNSKAGRISKGPMSMCCNWRCWFSLRSRRRHPRAVASITIYEDPDGLGFPRVAPVSFSHQSSRGPSVW